MGAILDVRNVVRVPSGCGLSGTTSGCAVIQNTVKADG
jgi:hypothetical protein